MYRSSFHLSDTSLTLNWNWKFVCYDLKTVWRLKLFNYLAGNFTDISFLLHAKIFVKPPSQELRNSLNHYFKSDLSIPKYALFH